MNVTVWQTDWQTDTAFSSRGKKTDHLSRRVVAAFSAAGEVDATGVDACRNRYLGVGSQIAGDADRQQAAATAAAAAGKVIRGLVERAAGPRRPDAHVEDMVEIALGRDDRFFVPARLFPVEQVHVVFRVQNDLLDLQHKAATELQQVVFHWK